MSSLPQPRPCLDFGRKGAEGFVLDLESRLIYTLGASFAAVYEACLRGLEKGEASLLLAGQFPLSLADADVLLRGCLAELAKHGLLDGPSDPPARREFLLAALRADLHRPEISVSPLPAAPAWRFPQHGESA
jgi:hypothetical protein